MRKMQIVPFLLTAALISCSLAGCSARSSQTPVNRDVFAMDTYMSLTVYGDGFGLDEAEGRIRQIEKLMSVTDPDSDISAVNNSNGQPTEVSPETAEVISAGLEFGRLTSGSLDITIYPVLREWGFTTDKQLSAVPDDDVLSELLVNVGYEKVDLNGNTVTVPPEYQLDLGALAKGYTSDQVIDILSKNGVKSAIISLGGNVKTLGEKPGGKPWSVAVRSPFGDGSIGIVEISGERAMVTSGGYERYFVGDDGRTYHHIIDPSNGYPADSGLVSVTIIAESGLLCDALSTGLFVSGADKAVELWKSHSDFDMILVTDSGKLLYTDGIEDAFHITCEMESEVIRRD